MKNLILFLLILLIPFIAVSQDSDKNRKFSVGLNFSPDYCYRTLKTDISYLLFEPEYRDNQEYPKFGYTAGVNGNYILNKKISFESGFYFSDKGETIKLYGTQLIGTPRDPNGFQNYFITINNKYYYLDIPFKVNIYLATKNTKFYISGGLSTNILLAHFYTMKSQIENNQQKTSTKKIEKEFYPINFAVTGGFGFSYDLNERYILRFEPVFRHSLTSIINDPVKHYLYSAGLNLGLSYKL